MSDAVKRDTNAPCIGRDVQRGLKEKVLLMEPHFCSLKSIKKWLFFLFPNGFQFIVFIGFLFHKNTAFSQYIKAKVAVKERVLFLFLERLFWRLNEQHAKHDR